VASFYTNAVSYIFYLGERVHILYICKLYDESWLKRVFSCQNKGVDSVINQTVSTLQIIINDFG
jgi:hypothetical protein